MDTIADMAKEIMRIYKESLEVYPFEEENESIDEYDNDEYDEEKFMKWMEEDDADAEDEYEEVINTDRLTYILDRILELPTSKFNNLVSLLVVYYYTITIDHYRNKTDKLDDEEELDDYLIVLNNIENKSVDDFLFDISQQNNDDLLYMMLRFAENEIEYYEEYHEEIDLEDFEGLGIVEAFNKKDYLKHIFFKFHPNLEADLQEYNNNLKKEEYLKKVSNIIVKSNMEFIQLFEVVKRNFNDKYYLKHFLFKFLDNMQNKSKETFKQIMIIILRYYYIKNYLENKEDLEYIKREVICNINDTKDRNINRFEYVIDEFLDFNFQSFMNDYQKIPNFDEIKKEFEEFVTLDNLKTYGVEGEWRSYCSKEEIKKLKDKTFKYCPYWSFDNNSIDYEKCLVYFSKGKTNKNNIPRIIMYVNSNNEIIEIYGREQNSCIEYELLDILQEKIYSFSNACDITSKISILRFISNINDKVNNNIDLTKEEICFLYDIDQKLDMNFFGRWDYRKNNIKEKTETKKCLAKYYDCEEKNIALNYKELDEETIVFVGAFQAQKNCNFPKLKVIFGPAFCDTLRSAKGLKSLEIIKDNAYFELLKSLNNLESLIKIEGDAHFNSIDEQQFNTNLYVDGDIHFSGGVKKKNKEKNKF